MLLLLLTVACQREPDFDQRYKTAEQKLAEKSQAMDREIAASEGAASESDEPAR